MSNPTIDTVLNELRRATEKFPKFNSPHEGIAVLREEYLELEREVFWGKQDLIKMEAIQVAAMALRFLRDCCDCPDPLSFDNCTCPRCNPKNFTCRDNFKSREEIADNADRLP